MSLSSWLSWGCGPNRVAASAQDGIIIYLSRGLKYADVECYNTGEVVATTREEGAESSVWEVESDGLKSALSDLSDFLTDG